MNRPILILLSGLLFTLHVCQNAFAKKGTIEWKEVQGADHYEIQIKLDEQVIVSETIPKGSNKWTGKLEPGLYYYRIRVIDKVQRAGEWSKYHPLVARPDAPLGVSSTQDVWTDKAGGVELKWDSIPHVKQYLVIVTKRKKEVLRQTTTGTSMYIPAIEPGNYRWQVQGLLKAGDRVPASISGMEAAGEFSKPLPLIVHRDPPRMNWRASAGIQWGLYDLQSNNITSATNSTLGTNSYVHLDRTINTKWDIGLRGSIDGTIILQKTRILPEIYIYGSHWFNRIEKRNSWEAAITFGLQGATAFIATGPLAGDLTFKPVTAGPYIGGRAGLRLSPELYISLYGGSYFPLMTLGPSGRRPYLAQNNLFQYFDIGFEFTWRLSNRWGLALGAHYMNKSLNFTLSPPASPHFKYDDEFKRKLMMGEAKLYHHFD